MRRQKHAFSLVELMVAVFISSIVVIAAFALMTGSRDIFHDQDDDRQLESNLRNAELLVQRDLSRVGYHAPFVKNNMPVPPLSQKQVYVCNSTGTSLIQNAFEYFDVNVTRSVVYMPSGVTNVDKHRFYTTFSMLGDLTDYYGFNITSMTKNGSSVKLTLSDTIRMPLSAHAFADFPEEKPAGFEAPTGEIARGRTYKSIFERMFMYAKAVYIVSSGNNAFVAPITEVKCNPSGAGCVGEVTVDLCNYGNFNFVGDGTNDFADAKLYPVLSVTYTVTPCGDTNCLARCYGDPFVSDIGDLLDLVPNAMGSYDRDNCQILLSNVINFTVLPLSVERPVYNSVDGNAPHRSINLKDVTAFHFEIEAYSPRVTPGIVNSSISNKKSGHYYYDANHQGHLTASITGTSILKTVNVTCEGTGVCANASITATSTDMDHLELGRFLFFEPDVEP